MIRFLFFLLFTIAVHAAEKISLPEALHLALENSPEYKTAKNNLESSELEAKNASVLFFPTLDLTTSHGVRGFDPDTQNLTARTPWASETTLALTENFYDNGETFKKSRIADKKRDLARLEHHRIRAQIIRKVMLAFWRNSIAIQNLEFVKKYAEELERLSKLVNNQYRQGLKTKKDHLNFKSREQRSKLDLIKSEKERAEAFSELVTALGLNPDAEHEFDVKVRPLLPVKKLKSEFSDSELYEFQQLELQKQISQIEIDLAKRRYWPEVSLVGAASYGSSDYVDTRQSWSDNDSTQWSVFLNIKFNLLDWGVRNRNIRLAQITQSTSENSKTTALLEVKKALEVFKVEVANSTDNYLLSKELQKIEEENFKLLERDYKSGLTSYLELTTGLANLLDAQSRGLEADFALADLYLRWKYYKGVLDVQTALE